MSASRFSKLSIALKYYLHGAKYFGALKAYAYAESMATGLRKDGITPEFQHQIEIALYIITLKNVADEERCIIAALLHDVREDYDIDHDYILEHFGVDAAFDVELLTKKFKGVEKDKAACFAELTQSATSSLVKGVDRINNLQSMTGVFTLEKQQSYIKEVDDYFLPMLKTAAELYPEMFLAYMNVRTMLKNQSSIIRASIDGSQFSTKK